MTYTMLLTSVQHEPTNVRKATVRSRALACVCGIFLYECKSVVSVSINVSFRVACQNLLFKGMRKSTVRYTLTTASNDISGIIETLCIPIMHCPFSIRAIRLQLSALCD